jgi:23S rRNA (cytosine1962-C5)-methyltransferase
LSEIHKAVVTRRGEDRLAAGHLWIYRADVIDAAGAGAVAEVRNQRGRLLGVAHYSSTSQIALRLLARGPATINRDFWMARLRAALAHRERVAPAEQACRIVHAEGDLLPGLVVDRYGPVLCAQFLTQGMEAARDSIAASLQELLEPQGILARNDAPARRHEGLPQDNEALRGEVPDQVEVAFNGLRWRVEPWAGQKTGVYLDQRENYLAAARHARGRALDCFTSTGGFALHLAARCSSVEGVDSSPAALATAEHNRALNGITNVSFREADVFDLLGGYTRQRRQFDTIVLDPPAFAKNRASVEGALRGYKDLHVRALRLLAPGGVLVTCSCSYHISEADLLQVAAEAALDAGRTLRVLERRAQAADHPVLLTVPETLYLKCLILEAL